MSRLISRWSKTTQWIDPCGSNYNHLTNLELLITRLKNQLYPNQSAQSVEAPSYGKLPLQTVFSTNSG